MKAPTCPQIISAVYEILEVGCLVKSPRDAFLKFLKITALCSYARAIEKARPTVVVLYCGGPYSEDILDE